MLNNTVLPAFVFGLGSFFSVYVALQAFSSRFVKRQSSDADSRTLIFLLRSGEVIDANFNGRRLLKQSGNRGTEYDQLRQHLAQSFENADQLLEPTKDKDELRVISKDGQYQLSREVSGDAFRLKIRHRVGTLPQDTDIHLIDALKRELETLRTNIMAAPYLLWRQDKHGRVTWVNHAYLEKAKQIRGSNSVTAWPMPVLFPQLLDESILKDQTSHRFSVNSPEDGAISWYDCHTTSLGDDTLCTAFLADEAVESDAKRREFTQTLTKTFAELATGLAIFDRSRRLVLFNPALMDLTNLPSDFLTSRPGMISFLDKLRENRTMPEPKDYPSWRKSISELEAAAANGTYSETWSLPDGQTYHVTGRPHPDGALALLFEDISAEMSLTRRYRAELEQSQDVIDAMDDAVAVFSSAGQLVLSNRAYSQLWRVDHETMLSPVDVGEATKTWLEQSAPTPVWGDFRDFVRRDYEREEWSSRVALRDGRFLDCCFQPLKAGSTLAVFREPSQPNALANSLREVG